MSGGDEQQHAGDVAPKAGETLAQIHAAAEERAARFPAGHAVGVQRRSTASTCSRASSRSRRGCRSIGSRSSASSIRSA